MLLCDALLFVKNDLELALEDKKGKSFRKKVQEILDVIIEVGGKVQTFCEEDQKNLEQNNYFS